MGSYKCTPEQYLQNIKNEIKPSEVDIRWIVKNHLIYKAESMLNNDSYSDVNFNEVYKGIHKMVMELVNGIKIEIK